MEQHELKERAGATPSGQPALVNQAPTGLGPSGFDRAQGHSLDAIEAERERAKSVARKLYFAERFMLMTAVHMMEDIDRAADKAREDLINRILNRRAA